MSITVRKISALSKTSTLQNVARHRHEEQQAVLPVKASLPLPLTARTIMMFISLFFPHHTTLPQAQRGKYPGIGCPSLPSPRATTNITYSIWKASDARVNEKLETASNLEWACCVTCP